MGLSHWCLLQEKDGRDMPLYCQRNHKHKISRTPLYPYGSEPMTRAQRSIPTTNHLLQWSQCFTWEDPLCAGHVPDLE